MLIKQIILDNFGLYRGRQQISLAPRVKYRQQRPVVLLGGQNGAGKSTILEALRLCLYGALSFGGKVTKKDYEDLLRSRVHRSVDPAIQISTAAVGLEFEYSSFGEVHTYSVERSWELSGNTVHTFLEVKRNGEPLDEVDQANADEFLRDLIPPGVSQLYFFDGEKIQELAEGEDDSDALGDAIRGLLGLDLVDQLNVDLKIYSRRLEDSPKVDPIKNRLEELATKKRQLQDKGEELLRAADMCQSRTDRLKIDIEQVKQKIAREGGNYAKKEEKLKAQQAQLTDAIRQAEDELRELCGGLLPFVLAQGLCEKLQDQLRAEHRIQAWQNHAAILSERVDDLESTLDDSVFRSVRLSDEDRSEVRQRVLELLRGLGAEPSDLPKASLVHRKSDDERDRLLSAIAAIGSDIPKRVGQLASQIEEGTRKLARVEDALGKIPAEDQIEPLLDRLGKLSDEYVIADKERDQAYNAHENHIQEIALIDREGTKLDQELHKASSGLDRRAMVGNVQAVLSEYSAALSTSKAAELTEAVASRFSQLWRKEQAVRRVEIDPSTYKVTLFDAQDRPIEKKQLSAGEKQVYAVSMLWALAEVSGRPLPVVIDTPLGRLDSQHRFHLVDHYFPNASHQVIILSTDTEIDEENYRELKPSISHAYQLRFDEQEGCTFVEEGYFWGRRKLETANADQ